MAAKKEKVAFQLERPDANTPVAQASDINFGDETLDASIEGRDAKANSNSGNIEGKVNALIDCINTLIQYVVFYTGAPYNVPQQLATQLNLLRVGDNSSTALCGQALCGQALCGNN